MDSGCNINMEKCEKCDNKSDDEQPQSSNNCQQEQQNNQQGFKDKKTKISLPSLGLNLRLGRSRRNKKLNSQLTSNPSTSLTTTKDVIKKLPKWSIKFNCTKKEPKVAFNQDNSDCCKCKCYRRTEEHIAGPGVVFTTDDNDILSNSSSSNEIVNNPSTSVGGGSSSGGDDNDDDDNDDDGNTNGGNNNANNSNNNNNREIANRIEEDLETVRGIYGITNSNSALINASFLDLVWMRSSVHEDCDEAARLARAREIEQGVEAPANFRPLRRVQLLCSDMEIDNSGTSNGGNNNNNNSGNNSSQVPRRLQLVCPPDLNVDSLRALFQNHVTLKSCPLDTIGCHTQVDFIHCLVPDLLEITKCSFYWGKMDRYEAERLLDGKSEGTFLLRDSAQEEFLFSVSFRKYGRSLHARIEQWNHKFSFDSHDPGVYTSDTVCGLIEHYKDPSSCMFFEPMLTRPLHRNFTFSLQHLCRAAIVNRLTYDNINQLQLPKTLKSFLKEYHYRQKVRVERFDDDVTWLELGNMPS